MASLVDLVVISSTSNPKSTGIGCSLLLSGGGRFARTKETAGLANGLVGQSHRFLEPAVVEFPPLERRERRQGRRFGDLVLDGQDRRPAATAPRLGPTGRRDAVAERRQSAGRTAGAWSGGSPRRRCRRRGTARAGRAAFFAAMPRPAASEVAETSGAAARMSMASGGARGAAPAGGGARGRRTRPAPGSMSSCRPSSASPARSRGTPGPGLRLPGCVGAQRGGAGERQGHPEEVLAASSSGPARHAGAAIAALAVGPATGAQPCHDPGVKASAAASSGVAPGAADQHVPRPLDLAFLVEVRRHQPLVTGRRRGGRHRKWRRGR